MYSVLALLSAEELCRHRNFRVVTVIAVYRHSQQCQFMKMVGGAETGRSRQPTYPYLFLLGFRPLYFEVQMKKY